MRKKLRLKNHLAKPEEEQREVGQQGELLETLEWLNTSSEEEELEALKTQYIMMGRNEEEAEMKFKERLAISRGIKPKLLVAPLLENPYKSHNLIMGSALNVLGVTHVISEPRLILDWLKVDENELRYRAGLPDKEEDVSQVKTHLELPVLKLERSSDQRESAINWHTEIVPEQVDKYSLKQKIKAFNLEKYRISEKTDVSNVRRSQLFDALYHWKKCTKRLKKKPKAKGEVEPKLTPKGSGKSPGRNRKIESFYANEKVRLKEVRPNEHILSYIPYCNNIYKVNPEDK